MYTTKIHGAFGFGLQVFGLEVKAYLSGFLGELNVNLFPKSPSAQIVGFFPSELLSEYGVWDL